MEAMYEKVDLLNQEAYSTIYKDISRADSLVKEAAALSSELNYSRGTAWSLTVSGLIELEYGNLDRAEENIYHSHNIFNASGDDRRGIIASVNALGLTAIRQGKIKEAFEHLQNALDSSRLYNIKDMEYRSVNLLGILQFHMENYNQALRFFNKALKLITDEKLGSILNNLGCCYRALGKYDLALEYLNKALVEAEKNDNGDMKIPVLEEIGVIYGRLELYEKGVEVLKEALNLSTDYHKRFRLSINIRLGELYIKMEDYESAEWALNRAREYITVSNSTNNRDLYLYLSGIYEIKGDYRQALTHYKNYHRLTGKVKSAELDQKIWELETEAIEEVSRRIRRIGEMGKLMTALLDREQVIETLYSSVRAVFDVHLFALGLTVPGETELQIRFYRSDGENFREVATSLTDPSNPEAWVTVHRTGLIFNDMEKDYQVYFPVLNRIAKEGEIRSVLCLPVEAGEERGFIAVYSPKKRAFNREDYEILEMLNSYATIAWCNARQTEIVREKNRELEILNKFDDLTGIYNRRHFLEELEKMWKHCSRGRHEIHLMIIDVDHFKKINDTWGHSAGDFCLRRMGGKFRELLQRSSDLFARYGGEEFIVALHDLTEEEAADMAGRIRTSIGEEAILWNGQGIRFTVSIGLCTFIPPEREKPEVEILISEADRNLYRSKSEGRDRLTATRLD